VSAHAPTRARVGVCACELARAALLIQHATHIRHALLSFVFSPTPLNFSTLAHKRQDFREKLLNINIFSKKKNLNIRFYQNLSSGSQVVSCWQTDGWTDRHDETNSRFSQLCKRAYKLRPNVDATDGQNLLLNATLRTERHWLLVHIGFFILTTHLL
jgi:hypothetical protein